MGVQTDIVFWIFVAKNSKRCSSYARQRHPWVAPPIAFPFIEICKIWLNVGMSAFCTLGSFLLSATSIVFRCFANSARASNRFKCRCGRSFRLYLFGKRPRSLLNYGRRGWVELRIRRHGRSTLRMVPDGLCDTSVKKYVACPCRFANAVDVHPRATLASCTAKPIECKILVTQIFAKAVRTFVDRYR